MPATTVAILKFVAQVLTAFGVNPQGPQAPTNPFAAAAWTWFRQLQVSVGAAPPVAGTPISGSPDLDTGTITGTLGASEEANLPLSYKVSTKPSQGDVHIDQLGTFTFTPTTAARRAAAMGDTPIFDTFTVTISDGLASTTENVTVAIAPLDIPKHGTPSVPSPDVSDGRVVGDLNFYDEQQLVLTYSVTTQPTQGSVTVDSEGNYTYTPTRAARLAAWTTTSDPLTDPATDSFVVTASNGQASTPQTVVVPVSPMQIPVDPQPLTVAISNDGKTLYVSNGGYTLNVIDTTTDAVTDTITLPHGGGQTLAISPDGTTLYVPVWGGGVVTVVDTSTKTVVTDIPVGDAFPLQVAVAPDGQFAYVVNHFGSVSVIDMSTNTVVDTVLIAGGGEVDGIAITPDGGTLYVANGYDFVSVIDIATHHVSTIANGGIFGVAVSPDGGTVYVSEAGPDVDYSAVNVIDADTQEVTDIIDVGGQPFFLKVSPDGKSLYVIAGGRFVTVDTTSHEITSSVGIPGSNWDLTISPDGKFAYVPLYGGATVAVIPLTTSQAT